MKKIPLRRRDGSVRAWALTSERDYTWLNRWRWCMSSTGYVVRSKMVAGHQHSIYMHRQILGLKHGDKRQGEHKNRNRLDCRRSNLRIAPRGEADNRQNVGAYNGNTSGYRGVSWDKRRHKWIALAQLDKKKHWLGYYDTAEEADAVVKAWRAENMPFSEDAKEKQ